MTEAQLRRKLAWLISFRVAIVTLLLGSAILVQINTPGALPADPFFNLIGLTYALTIVYAQSLRFAHRHRWWIDVQLACDALIVSAFIYVTGGVTSYFSSLYFLPIIAASMLQFRRGALMVAVLSTLIYCGLVAMQYLGASGLLPESWGPSVVALPPFKVAQYTVGINVFGFLAVAVLSGSLAESLRHAGARLELASNEIADLQAFNEHVIDSLISGLATTDFKGQILTFNRAACMITRLSAESVIGRPIGEVMGFPPELTKSVESQLGGASSRQAYRAEFPYRMPEGQTIEIGLSASPLDIPGGRAGLLFTFQDVTDVKKLERDARLRQRLAAVGEMAAGIAHEIRNPLASMAGSIQILRQELPLSAEQAQLMDIVLRESERLNDTIRSFLAYARPQRFHIARLDIRRVLRDTALLLRNSAEVKEGHLVEVDVPPTEVLFDADENQIRQIVWNLATNGLRAMLNGGRLQLVARAESASDVGPQREDSVVLEVKDEGVGIPPEELDGIFQPFHGSFSRGSGLGLAIVHRIVSDYGGEILVSSAPGLGTTVTVRLPARALAATA
jgi:two-component system sensor histidine kinase PilS (NtrC family)